METDLAIELALLERLRSAAELLEQLAADRGLLNQLPAEDRARLLRATAELYNPDKLARREMLKWRYEVQHIATAVSLVEAGVGATIIPKLALNLRLCPTLRGVTLRNPSLTRSLGIVSKRDKPLSPLATQFRSMIVKHFAKQSKADARLS